MSEEYYYRVHGQEFGLVSRATISPANSTSQGMCHGWAPGHGAATPWSTGKPQILNWIQIPEPPTKSSPRSLACEMLLSGGQLRVSQTLPPITDPLPIVMRPRMVAPA